MSATRAQVLAAARKQLGYREGRNNDTKYGIWYGANHQPWCAMFVSFVFASVNHPLYAQTRKGFSYTPAGARWFKLRRRWGTTPRPGAVVFFYWPSMGRIAHVGIVESVDPDGKNMTTIEGNTNNTGSREGVGVFRMRRSTRLRANGGVVAGYGYPAYRSS